MIDATTLMRQAAMTADTYLAEAMQDIDRRLGPGYANKNPLLVGAYMLTAAIDYHANAPLVTGHVLGDSLCHIANAISDKG